MSRQWSRSELGQQLRAEITAYLGAASAFDEGLAKQLKLSRTDMRCLDLIGRHGPMTAGQLAVESGLTTGAVTFILDRLEEAGMVARRREIVPEAQERLQGLQQPVAEEMRQVAQRFKADELAVVRDFMRQAKEVFQRQVSGTLAGDAGPSDSHRTESRTAALRSRGALEGK